MIPLLLPASPVPSQIPPAQATIGIVEVRSVPDRIASQAFTADSKASPLPISIHIPAPIPTPSASPTQATSYSGDLAAWLLALRMCESGSNYQENTGNSFYGAYQFTIPTWDHWNTGYARADLAPASVQDATIIINTNASTAGLASQNPGCYAKEHLSAFPPTN